MKAYAKVSYQCAACGSLLLPYTPPPGEKFPEEPLLYHPMLYTYGECPHAYKKVRFPAIDLEEV